LYLYMSALNWFGGAGKVDDKVTRTSPQCDLVALSIGRSLSREIPDYLKLTASVELLPCAHALLLRIVSRPG
jgi:hypothetical protein